MNAHVWRLLRRLLWIVLPITLVVTGSALARAATTTDITFDTGSGVVFTVDGMNGDMKSLQHNGVELAAPGQAAGQFESGWTSANVSSQTFNRGQSILVTAANPSIGVTQYYFARRGDNTIYLATNISSTLDPAEARFISRLDSSLLPDSAVAANTGGSSGAIEGSDVFGFPDGTTASKFYSSQRLIAQQPYGASGPGHGVFIIPGTQEESSGGPFFRDIEVNNTGDVTNLTAYLFSSHAQTESLRTGLHGPYALAITDGSAPAATNLDFLSSFIPGLLSARQRGTVRGQVSGSFGGLPVTVALAGPNGQFWTSVAATCSFTIPKVRPGTYTATLYAGELAIGTPASVTVSAGRTATVNLSGNVPTPGSLFQIGTFDGTPAGFLNADRIETEHPSDVRMSPWTVANFDATAPASGFPMALFKTVNSPLTVTFNLDSVPANGAVLRIATTLSFAGGRPAIAIGDFTSPSSDSPLPTNLDSRGVTRGTWRGINHIYTFTIPASALQVGSNAAAISVVSGSSGTGFLSPNFVFDALALDPA
jgi:rhamnogalacturonan endolyase